VLGSIDDIEEFMRIVDRTPLPRRGGNCQTWVRNVVAGAIDRGLLKGEALRTLARVPRQ
jgi:hypothetical protein